MKITKYTVKNNQYEFDCPICGGPVYSGEIAFEVECNLRGIEESFCSKECNNRDLRHHKVESMLNGKEVSHTIPKKPIYIKS